MKWIAENSKWNFIFFYRTNYYIHDKTSKIDTLIEKSKKSIELLKEKRTALISAAVTGKIDVREEI